MKTLHLQLSDEQFARLELVAKLAGTTPEKLSIANTFSEIDGWCTWREFIEILDSTLFHYTEDPRDASSEEPGHRLEDDAPERYKKLANYKSPTDEVDPSLDDSKNFVSLTEYEVAVAIDALKLVLETDWDGSQSENLVDWVKDWRRDFADYVNENQAEQKAGVSGALKCSKADAENFLECQTAAADLLEKLAKQLPAEEVSHA